MAAAVTITVVGLIIGVLLGLLGGGGAILAVPALVYLIGLPVTQAIPMSLIVVAAAALSGAYTRVRERLINWRLAAIFAAAGMPAAALGTVVGRNVPQDVLLAGFAILMIAAGIRMVRKPAHVGTACTTVDPGTGVPKVNWRRCTSRSIPAGLGVGFVTGLFGVGGGFVVIPALVLLLGITMPVAVGTSLVVIAANASAGLIGYIGTVSLDLTLTALFAAAAIIGSFAAGRLSARVSGDKLQRWFAYLVFVVAAAIAIELTVRTAMGLFA
ncbi:sulfite exporter TauE/SafE family protein [Hoyosella sp. YIM 151337]|uniref:sulfite exporter TauE/SafE family protein n=1 Tax=Hoyosella sp. YIM 151337 TaxID=2992742 RepID=UPI002236049B|nr:sulfite exporter TauE/SafE family protein [Hoyosella sp. YIM 151337]MCW4355012.1 sulfite exporter TauE/SafE family protein [Hoyosella sp. YIM 151337]